MDFYVKKSTLQGCVTIPGSKSHTIRALLLAALSEGESVLRNALDSSDTRSCRDFIQALGAEVKLDGPDTWFVSGVGGSFGAVKKNIDVGNSGTTLFLGMAVAALGSEDVEITGDEQTQRRDAGPLLNALSELGATAYSVHKNGCAPLVVGGGLKGGEVTVECPTSQYLSALLIACPHAESDTVINVPLLYEVPYVDMTVRWLEELGVMIDYDEGYKQVRIPGGCRYGSFDAVIPADFSSAAFFLLAAAVTGSRLALDGLDMSDAQGDKEMVKMLEKMGCRVGIEGGAVIIKGPEILHGSDFDLNATPDLLPAMAVAGAFAEGTTRLLNVPQARIKETDRISVMTSELRKMGIDVKELEDGMVIEGSAGKIKGGNVHGYGDHRVVMALAAAGLAAQDPVRVDTAEAVEITFPEFKELMLSIGADIQ